MDSFEYRYMFDNGYMLDDWYLVEYRYFFDDRVLFYVMMVNGVYFVGYMDLYAGK